jgi:hypothetical protein
MNKLVLDNNKIRNCPKNKRILGYWKTFYYFHSYKKIYSGMFSKDLMWAIITILNSLLSLFLVTILSPILPFLRAFIDWRRSVIECKKYATQKKSIGEQK